ncbi:alcohol dehydrogenase [Staphylococcus hominis]|nr:alcohol dehydrogenase [Staphylococcus hominis]MDS3925552.1 alcohol dehydrogenase [Staphylococcus hominis]
MTGAYWLTENDCMKAVTYQGYKNMEVCEVNDTTEIITHTIPLEDVKEAYDIFDQKKDNTIKVILKSQ